MLSPEYVAGLFDADGCVGAYCRTVGTRPYINVSVANNCHHVLNMLKDQFGGALEGRGDKRCKVWRINGSSMTRPFLELILPFSVVKHEQIEVALKILALPKHDRSVAEEHYALAAYLKELKRAVTCEAQH